MNNAKKIAFLFPGQGAQYVGMAKDFFETFAIARQTFEEADDKLGDKLSHLILNGPEGKLIETKNSQPAIFVASMAILRVLQSLFPLKPSLCAGLSLGEYTALCASEKLTFVDCLSLIQRRANLMNEACEKTRGTMAVILGLEGEAVEKIVRDLNQPNDLWVANFNCPGQVVISGTPQGIEAGAAAAKMQGAKKILPLPVHGAFHSGLMQLAEERLSPFIEKASLKESEIGLVMNVPGCLVKEISKMRIYLARQVTSSVKWEQGIRNIHHEGIDLYLEIGCGKTLTGFNKRIGVAAPTLSVEKIEEIDQLSKIL